jgi:hypothetical protein
LFLSDFDGHSSAIARAAYADHRACASQAAPAKLATAQLVLRSVAVLV